MSIHFLQEFIGFYPNCLNHLFSNLFVLLCQSSYFIEVVQTFDQLCSIKSPLRWSDQESTQQSWLDMAYWVLLALLFLQKLHSYFMWSCIFLYAEVKVTVRQCFGFPLALFETWEQRISVKLYWSLFFISYLTVQTISNVY